MSKKNEEYVPKDNSGTDYTQQVGMSAADKKALDAAGAAWNTANAAGDQAGMDAAHKEAERIRAKYNYSGGADGSEYIKLSQDVGVPKQTKSFSYSTAPSYASKYQKQIDSLADKLLDRPAFSYDPEKDPTYQQYKDSYTRQGQRAMADTLGQVSARTGGLSSSYAQAASQQTYDSYMTALADKIPELKQLAYEMYLNEGENQRANLSMLQGLDNTSYGRYADQLNQYNTDRSFAYGMYQDDRNYNYQLGRDAIADQRYQTEWDYGVYQDLLANQRYDQQWQHQLDREAIADQRYDTEWGHQVEQDRLDNEYRDKTFLYQQEQDRLDNEYRDNAFLYQQEQDKLAYDQWREEFDYGKEQDALSYDQWLKAFEYGKEQDALAFQQWLDEFNYGKEQDAESNAQWWAAFNYGKEQDALANSRLDDETAYNRGIYADGLNYQRALDKAETMAMAGDFSGYKALGYTDSEIAVMKTAYDREMAQTASGGGSSGGSKGGGSTGTTTAQNGILATMLGMDNDIKAIDYLYALGLSGDKTSTLREDYEKERERRMMARNPLVKLDFDQDEGIFRWNGGKYSSMESLLSDVVKKGLTATEKDTLKKNFQKFGFRNVKL